MLCSLRSEKDTQTTYNAAGYLRNESTGYNQSQYNYTWPPHELVCIYETPTENFIVSPIFRGCVYFMYSAVFVVALIGNGLVCFVVQSTPRMKTVTNYFIVNLAVGDILMTLFCVPFSFVSMLILRYWPFGAVMCRVVNFSQAVSVLVSAYTLLAISIDRYIVIMCPLKPRLGKVAAKMVVAGVWGGALITAAPIPIVSRLQRPSLWYEACDVDVCGEQWSDMKRSEQYTYALLALQFALPLSALVFTYARIAHAVWGGRPPGEAHSARDSRMHLAKRKMIKMMVTVVAVFTVCWLPLNIFIVLWTAHESDEEWAAWPGMPYAWFASHWLAMSHSCYNPIIYCYMNARYRQGFKQKRRLDISKYIITPFPLRGKQRYIIEWYSRYPLYARRFMLNVIGGAQPITVLRALTHSILTCAWWAPVSESKRCNTFVSAVEHLRTPTSVRASIDIIEWYSTYPLYARRFLLSMTEMVGVNATLPRRALVGSKGPLSRNATTGHSNKPSACASARKSSSASAFTTPARALSIRAHYF